MPSVSVTVCRRPEYTFRTLSLLSGCVGVGEWDVSIFVDNQCGETLDVVKSVSLPSWMIHVSEAPLGCNENVRRAFRHGMSISDFHVHLEDDTAPARDALCFFKWSQQFGSDPTVFCSCGYSRKGGDADAAVRGSDYTAWGLATWRDRWEEMDANWSPHPAISWDTWMDQKIRNGRDAVTPLASRIQNIGQFNGTYNNPHVWAETQFTRQMVPEGTVVRETEWRLIDG